MAKNDFTWKMKYIDNFTKIAWECGLNNYWHRLWKVAHSEINRPIWSHWVGCPFITSKMIHSCYKNKFCTFVFCLLLPPPPQWQNLNLYFSSLSIIATCVQCDQIGRFLKYLCQKLKKKPKCWATLNFNIWSHCGLC